MQINQKICCVLFISSLFACTTGRYINDDSETTHARVSAICVAHHFLGRNGYIYSLNDPDLQQIDLEIWDNINFGTNGEIDFGRLLKSRLGSYDERYNGLREIDGDFYVNYQLAESRSCVFVSGSFEQIEIVEANCKTPDWALLLRDFEPDEECSGISTGIAR